MFAGEDSPGGAQVTMFTHEAAQAHLAQPGRVDAIKVLAEDGVSSTELAERISATVPAEVEVLTGAEITGEQQDDLKADMSFLNVFLMVFALIALFVGSFIIYNSFSILVAQRTREMALLRAIGAHRRQVMASVIVESVVIGLVASLLGLAAGIGVAAALQAMLAGMGLDLPTGGIVITSTTVVAALVAGLGVSVASAVLPARRASRVPPIAAMREVAHDTSARSRRRVAVGVAVTGLGAATMAAGLFGDAGIAMVGLGAPIVFIGVAVLGPVLARPLSRVIGAPLAALRGMTGTIARENAMRNPKRTSATAAALMIGVALVGLITILAASTKASIASSIEDDFRGDLVVAAQGGMGTGGLSTDLADRLASLPELDAVTGYRIAAAEVDGHGTTLAAADPVAAEVIGDLRVTDGSATDLDAGTIAVYEDTAEANGWAVGDTVPVRFAGTGEQPLTIGALFEESTELGDYLVGLDTYDANVADRFDYQVVVTVADGVGLDQARRAVTTVADAYPLADVQDVDEYTAAQGAKAGTILNLMYVLLGLAVFIALLGITNTLALSIFERTRELGLLRAVGMTRNQLRRSVRYEAVIIALLGTALGLVIGTGFGWAIVQALEGEGLTTFAVPVGTLAALTVVGAVAGIAAAVLPARRAARLDVLEAIVTD
jgi:putative ABC transport system permease protein